MKASVLKDVCIGCGLCITECPEVFELVWDNKASVIPDIIPQEFEESVSYARDICPVDAIVVE